MTKPLLIVTIVVSLAAAVLGFLNQGTLTQTRTERDSAQTELASTKDTLQKTSTELDTAKKDIEAKAQEITTLTGEKDKLNTELTATKQQVTDAQAKLTEAEGNVSTLTAEATAAKEKIDALTTENETLKKSSTTGQTAEAPDTQAQLDELKAVNAKLEEQVAGLKSEVASAQAAVAEYRNNVSRPGIQGTILAVNQAWNFVVLSLGDRQGLKSNSELLVQRDGQLLGKVRVTSVEPSTSIADILVRTVPRGFSIMPGDKVIYQASARD